MWCPQLIRCSLRALRGSLQCKLIPNVPTVTSASFHLNHANSAKLFLDKENEHAHNVLMQSPRPYQIFRPAMNKALEAVHVAADIELPKLVLNSQQSDVTIEELFRAFIGLTQYCTFTNTFISDERFVEFCQLFCKQSYQLSDEQLLAALGQLAELPTEVSVRSPNYMQLWNNLDVECCRRIERWNSDELLLVCDAWYVLNLGRICVFVSEAMRKLGRKVRRMRPEHMVHTMFFCNLLRRSVFEMFDFEVNLLRCADSMSLQELGVMSMGFFKTQTPIRTPELLDHLYARLLAETDTVDDITLVAILKVLRYSSKLPQVGQLLELMDALQAQISRFSLLSCLHIALFGVELQCCHDGILELVLQRFNLETENSRLKDMERICLAMSVFNYRSPTGVEQTLCSKILDVLQTRVDEIIKHPRCFASCVHYLTLCGYHNAEMISSMLDRRFIEHAYGKNMALGREIFNVDSYVQINLKESGYDGNQLPTKMRRTMGKVLTHYIPERNTRFKLNLTDRILLEIKETLDRVLRPNNFKHILPHYERPDVVICYDNKLRQAVPLSENCPEDYSGEILTRKELLGDLHRPEMETVAIVIAGWNNVVKDRNRYTATFEMKLQQLRILGHKPVVIYWYEWREQETPMDRQKLLKRKLSNAINL